jgi:hypothetical protein
VSRSCFTAMGPRGNDERRSKSMGLSPACAHVDQLSNSCPIGRTCGWTWTWVVGVGGRGDGPKPFVRE